MATMIHPHPTKRLHEEDSIEHDCIKRPRVISPRSPLSESTTTTTAVEVFPDAVELPEDIHQRRKHSLDTLSEEHDGYSSEVEAVEKIATGQSPANHHLHSRQRRRIEEEDVDEDAMGHIVMLPAECIRNKIPDVLLEPHKNLPLSPTTIQSTTRQQSTGPVIEEIPFNPLALVPYSPPPLIFFPGLSSSANAQQRDTVGDSMLTSAQEEEEGGGGDDGHDVDAMEVLPMLTPLDPGYMLGPMNTSQYEDDGGGGGGDDAMEE